VRRASDDRPARPAAQLQGPEITLRDRSRSITIRDLREPGPSADLSPGLEVSADGRPIGRIAFGRSSVPLAAESIRELRQHGPPAIGLDSDRPGAGAGRLAAALDMDFHVGGLSSDAKAFAVRSFRERRLKVAYVGDRRREPDAARVAYVAISMDDAVDPAHDPALVLVLRTDLDWAAGLRDWSRSHGARLRTIHGAVLVPNLLCIAGAFFLGFTSLAAVVLTHLGTLAVFSGLPNLRGSRALPSLVPGRRP
jgi:cation transport ATPase